MLVQYPVRDLEAAFAHEAERLSITHMGAEFLLIEDNDLVLSHHADLDQAKRALAGELIARLDDLRKRVVKPLFRMN